MKPEIENFLSDKLSKLGGDFNKSPEKVKLSDGAKKLIHKAFEDLPEDTIYDYHCHLLGLKAYESYIGYKMRSPIFLTDKLKFNIYATGAGIDDLKKADTQYIQRLCHLISLIPGKKKVSLLALDQYYGKNGKPDPDITRAYVSNTFMFEVCKAYPNHFIPCISIHPYRKDAIKALEKWASKGVKMLKWIPNEMNINPTDPICEPFYKKMIEHDMVLLTHTGKEDALSVMGLQHLGNPLLFRKPLDMGLKIIMAHCAGLGKSKDLDNPTGKKVKNYKLFLRLMDEKKYEGQLWGDISGITQINRCGKPLKTILKRKDLHQRLINGSDYPLPAINSIISTLVLQKLGYITSKEKKHLNKIYKFNPLLFDFVLKRTLKHPKNPDRKFSKEIFTQNHLIGI
jgi:uncharacterized protein